MVIRNLGVHMKKNPSLSHTEKENQYKYSKSLNLQPKTLTLLDIGKKSSSYKCRQGPSQKDSHSTGSKPLTDKWDYMELKDF